VKKKLSYLAALALAASAANAAWADQIVVSGSGTADSGGAVGFEATINYNAGALGDNQGSLTITMKNTLGNGNITAFVFNVAGSSELEVLTPNPTDLVAGDNAFWNLTSQSQLTDTEGASPFGEFDAGVGIGANPGTGADASFEGSGSGGDVEGIGRLSGGANGVESGTFNWTVTGAGADALTALSFASQLSDGNGNNDALFLVRFKGVPNANGQGDGGSAKIPGDPTVPGPVIPLPGVASASLALMGLVGVSRRRRSRA